MKSGFISIVGRPNVGKSTLINELVNHKVAITSNKVGTTRNNILGIYHEKDLQMIFVDTPGIGRADSRLGEVLNTKAYQAMENDLVLFVVDIASGFGKTDIKILGKLKNDNKDIILVLNKVDKINNEILINRLVEIKDLYNFLEIVPVSSLKGKNVDTLRDVIKKHLKDDIPYFTEDTITNVSEKFMAGEIIREKVLMLTKEEVPHAVTVVIEQMTFKKNVIEIMGLIVVDRKNLKGILIGKQGSMLKKIGSLARDELETFFDKKVFLELYVKTMENWRNKESSLVELGISEIDD